MKGHSRTPPRTAVKPVAAAHFARCRRRRWPLAFAIAAALASPAASADEEALKTEIAELRAELGEVRTQMTAIAVRNTSTPIATTAATPSQTQMSQVQPREPTQAALAARIDRLEQSVAAQADANSETTLFGYGEIAYSKPTHLPYDAQADFARAVLGCSHRFDQRTRMAAELEVEHAVASAHDKGEVEIEQLYAERQFTASIGGRAGLMLAPMLVVHVVAGRRSRRPTLAEP